MGFLITEIQIACIVLMGLMTFLLSYTLTRLGNSEKVHVQARRMLSTGSFLVALHFIIQYTLHKTGLINYELRTTINLLFGIPFSYLFFLSLLHLQRKGDTRLTDHLHVAVPYTVSLCLLAGVLLVYGYDLQRLGQVNLFLALVYYYSLIHTGLLNIHEYRRIVQSLREKKDEPMRMLVLWTRWAMYVMLATAMFMPIMTFVPHLGIRAAYGIVCLAVGHFYIFSFIGYYLHRRQSVGEQKKVDQLLMLAAEMSKELQREKAQKAALESEMHELLEKQEQAEAAAAEAEEETVEEIDPMARVDETYPTHSREMIRLAHDVVALERKRIFLKPGLTVKDLADELGVSSEMLTTYFKHTTFGKFNQWLMVNRIEEAKKMLIDHPEWSNEIVSQHCGYANRAYFQTQFSECTGLTPLKWVKQFRD